MATISTGEELVKELGRARLPRIVASRLPGIVAAWPAWPAWRFSSGTEGGRWREEIGSYEVSDGEITKLRETQAIIDLVQERRLECSRGLVKRILAHGKPGERLVTLRGGWMEEKSRPRHGKTVFRITCVFFFEADVGVVW